MTIREYVGVDVDRFVGGPLDWKSAAVDLRPNVLDDHTYVVDSRESRVDSR